MLNERSKKNLIGVKPQLVKVIELAASRLPFVVTEGLRTPAKQKQLLAEKKTQTLESRHLTGDAVDIYCGSWEPKDFMPALREIYKAGNELGIKLRFGCNWSSNPDDKTSSKFKDYPHIELPKS
ncbi:UNVERIFIED_CONTAM: M15 family metallopeptidase [Kocuria sp. CPCC 205274]